MLDLIKLVLALVLLLFTLRKMSSIGKTHPQSSLKEIKRNSKLLFWGVWYCFFFLLIPYQIWVITGSSSGWDGAYIIGGAAVFTVIMSFAYYSINSIIPFHK
ncbi:hypothetical protein HF072_04005 [Bacillus sp. RO3]|nr:hypothetical protein [Bacillus sp. RO3]